MRGPPLPNAALGILTLSIAAGAFASASRAGVEPRLCTEAIALSDADPLQALAKAEASSWRVARNARREARALSRQTVGMGESRRSFAATRQIDELSSIYEDSIRGARVLCGCRAERGDPEREDCDDLYRKYLPVPGDTDDAPQPDEAEGEVAT